MGVGLTNLGQEFFDFKAGQRLVYNRSTDTFLIQGRYVALEENCTANLKEINNRVKKILKDYPLNTLSNLDLLYLMQNIGTLNEIQARYNREVLSNRCLFVIDKLLQIVTLGFIRLTYKHFSLSEFEAFFGVDKLKQDQAKTLHILDTLIHSPQFITTLHTYAGYVLEAAESFYPQLNEEQRNRLVVVLNHLAPLKLPTYLCDLLDKTPVNFCSYAFSSRLKIKFFTANTDEKKSLLNFVNRLEDVSNIDYELKKILLESKDILEYPDLAQRLLKNCYSLSIALKMVENGFSPSFIINLEHLSSQSKITFIGKLLKEEPQKTLKVLKGTNELSQYFLAEGGILALLEKDEIAKDAECAKILLAELKKEGEAAEYIDPASFNLIIQKLMHHGLEIAEILELLPEKLQNSVLDGLFNKNAYLVLHHLVNTPILENYFKTHSHRIAYLLEDEKINHHEVIKQFLLKQVVYQAVVNFSKNEQRYSSILDTYPQLLKEVWLKIDFPEKEALLKFIVEQRKDEIPAFSLEHILIKILLENYEQISEEEKEYLLPILIANDASLNFSKEVLLDLLQLLLKNKKDRHHSRFDKVLKTIFTKIRARRDLSDKDKLKLLKIADDCDFEPFCAAGCYLKDHLPVDELFGFLVRNTKHVPECSRIAVQFCFAKALDEKEKGVKEIELLLENVHFYKLKETDFQILTDLKTSQRHRVEKLAQIILRDHDKFLGTASEEQLEKFYSDKDAGLSVNQRHMAQSIRVGNMVAPPLPNGVEVEFSELTTMMDTVNFTHPQEEGFQNPNQLLDDGGRTSVERVKLGMNQFVTAIPNPRGFWGAPDPITDPQGFENFKNNLHLFVKHSILRLRDMPAAVRNIHLINLGIAGLHCGGRYMGVAQDLYSQVTGSEYFVDGESLEGVLLGILSEKRLAIFNGEFAKVASDSHSRVAAMKQIGLQFGLNEAKAYNYEDPYRGCDDHFRSSANCRAFFKSCLNEYSATHIINAVVKQINGVPGHDPTIKHLFRNSVLDVWLKDQSGYTFETHITKQNRKEWSHDRLEREVALEEERRQQIETLRNEFLFEVYDENQVKIKRKWVVKLLLAHKILERKNRAFLKNKSKNKSKKLEGIGTWILQPLKAAYKHWKNFAKT